MKTFLLKILPYISFKKKSKQNNTLPSKKNYFNTLFKNSINKCFINFPLFEHHIIPIHINVSLPF